MNVLSGSSICMHITNNDTESGVIKDTSIRMFYVLAKLHMFLPCGVKER